MYAYETDYAESPCYVIRFYPQPDNNIERSKHNITT
jgi:hypothetical protein